MDLYPSFILPMIIIFTPVIFANWTKENPPKSPKPDTLLSCIGWILFYDFDPDKTEHNLEMAGKRDHTYDRNVFLWTASYVYILSRSGKNQVTPKKFCENRGMNERPLFTFLTLDGVQRTCEDWITFYGYDPDIRTVNHTKAKLRSRKMDFDISMWAAGYGIMISQNSFNSLLPSGYCDKMSVTDTKVMDFMTYNSTLFACEDWIKLYDYTDDPHYNYNKAVNTYKPYLKLYLNRWVEGYASELLTRGQNQAIPPAAYCEMQRDGTVKTFYFPEFVMLNNQLMYGNS